MKYEEVKDLNTLDIMQYLLKDLDVKDFKNVTSKSMVEGLKRDCIVIQIKMFKALKSENMGTYNNLQKALVNNINAIKVLEEDDYKPMWSIYKTGSNEGNLTPQVAVWMQNGKGEISGHQAFDIDYKIKADTINGVCNIEFDKCKDDSYYDKWERNMELLIYKDGNDKIIIPTSEVIRGVGKTTFLVKQAIKNDGIYIGANRWVVENAKDIADKEFNSVLNAGFFTTDGLNISIYDKPLYIDEGVDLTKIDLNKNKYVAFKYIPLNSL